jgi:hypothetical protein
VDAHSTPTPPSVDETTKDRTDANAEKKDSTTMKPGVSDTEHTDASPHDALPEQAVEARGQIEELIAAAGAAKRPAAPLAVRQATTAADDEPDLFDSAPLTTTPAGDAEVDGTVERHDSKASGNHPPRQAAAPFDNAPGAATNTDSPTPRADGKTPSAAALKRRHRGSARVEDTRREPAASPSRSTTGRRAIETPAPPTDKPVASPADDDGPAPPSAEHTLRQILQELRNQRVVSGDFSWTTVLALVVQMMVVVCVAAALLMGGGNSELFMRWMACAIVLQLATLTMMLFRR